MDARDRSRPRRRKVLCCEMFERREVPATFGAPWADAAHLSVSFAADGTAIAGHASSLFSSLDAARPTDVWERTILEALQTWASLANINIGLTVDNGQAFGASGLIQHDPRFGDIRVGAQPMAADALSISVPFDPALSGTWSGDLLFNSESLAADSSHLFEIALHEAGHILGLKDSADPNSAMFSNLSGHNKLSQSDIDDLRSLYGTRSLDAFEGSSGNASISKAASVPIPGGYQGQTPLVLFGDLGDAKDVDFYSVRPLSGYKGPMTVRLQSAGISLLGAKLSVLDAKGKVLATAQASSGSGDVVSIFLGSVDPSGTYYLKVESATGDAFGVGSYGLAVSYDALNRVAPGTLDAVLRQGNRGLKADDLAAALRDPSRALYNDDRHTDDTIGSSVKLTSTAGYATLTHYEAIGSLSDASDADVYRVDSPNVSGRAVTSLTVALRSLGTGASAPRVLLTDREGVAIPFRILANGGDTFTVQADGIKAGANVYVRVQVDPSLSTGNYAMVAEFGTPSAQLTNFVGGTLDADTASIDYNLYVGRSQLFQFLLSGQGAVGDGLAVEILDADGQVVFSLDGGAGDTTSGPAALLTPGAYKVRIRALTPIAQPLAFSLDGGSISDPIGPTLLDPTFAPIYTDPKLPGVFTFPGLPPTTNPYAFAVA